MAGSTYFARYFTPRTLFTLPNPQIAQDIPRYVPIAADYCRSAPGGRGAGGGEGAGGSSGAAGAVFLASVMTRFLRDEAGRILEVESNQFLNPESV